MKIKLNFKIILQLKKRNMITEILNSTNISNISSK